MKARVALVVAAVLCTSACMAEMLKQRGANDLRCNPADVVIENRGLGSYVVEGCGRSAEYLCSQATQYQGAICDLRSRSMGDPPAHTASRGELGGACYPNDTCNADLFCSEKQCVIWEYIEREPAAHYAVGAVGGACRPDGGCDAPFSCTAGRCAPAGAKVKAAPNEEGHEGGACYGNSTCNKGLTCDHDDVCKKG